MAEVGITTLVAEVDSVDLEAYFLKVRRKGSLLDAFVEYAKVAGPSTTRDAESPEKTQEFTNVLPA